MRRQHNTRSRSRIESQLTSLPIECLVEVLRFLETDELLGAAWTCQRFQQAARDSALWSHTHFSLADWHVRLERYFAQDTTRMHHDHTGKWSRCVCRLTNVSIARRFFYAPPSAGTPCATAFSSPASTSTMAATRHCCSRRA